MKVQTGQGTIPLITLIGIFSISALNALPGLAVSPILGDLNKIFRLLQTWKSRCCPRCRHFLLFLLSCCRVS